MKSKVFFSDQLVVEANAKLAKRRDGTRRTLPLEVGDIIYSMRQSTDEIRTAFEIASARLRKM
ncbi:hypothetical protein ACI2KC_16115 [Pseudomonas monteilii]|jgi:hypothetical protein|uniref:hypothetical protein n=1 Tax=Pseudomonas alabamensis TaxID=3064349 RepID=UPI000745DCD1|nr:MULTISPECIES: hypothetical protein [Pseudomonas]AMA44507.1 hypothetical protein APT63_02120 [Pseudomonas monteilii]MDO7909874.1 hypothetical protein [Pseudomonas sp. 22-AL-CL-001]